ncbi:MAG: M17 family peptidase N-terminal domain-containing protein, partial [Desulfatiglandales bacterium]
CQAVVAFLFEGDSLLTGYLSRLNDKLAGSLAPLMDRRFLTGKRDEILLIASQERIKADKVLFVGLGPASSYSSEDLSYVMSRVSSNLERLKLNEFGIMVPWGKEVKIDYVELIKSIIGNLVDYYFMSKEDAVDFSLKIVLSIEERFFDDLQSLEQELRIYLNPIIDYSILIDESRGT